MIGRWAGIALVVMAAWVQPAYAGKASMLLQAVVAGDVEQVREIVRSGADLEVRDPQGRTALLLATRGAYVEIAELLIEAGADVNAKDSIEDTPYLYAGAEGRDDILKLILASGRTNLRDTNRYGGTALIPAAHHGHLSTVTLLIEAGVDVNHINRLGWTALMEAVILGDGSENYRYIVDALIWAGARNLPDNEGKTPLEYARERGYGEIAVIIGTARDWRFVNEVPSAAETTRIGEILESAKDKDWNAFTALNDRPFNNAQAAKELFEKLDGLSHVQTSNWKTDLDVVVVNDGHRILRLRLPSLKPDEPYAILMVMNVGEAETPVFDLMVFMLKPQF